MRREKCFTENQTELLNSDKLSYRFLLLFSRIWQEGFNSLLNSTEQLKHSNWCAKHALNCKWNVLPFISNFALHMSRLLSKLSTLTVRCARPDLYMKIYYFKKLYQTLSKIFLLGLLIISCTISWESCSLGSELIIQSKCTLLFHSGQYL